MNFAIDRLISGFQRRGRTGGRDGNPRGRVQGCGHTVGLSVTHFSRHGLMIASGARGSHGEEDLLTAVLLEKMRMEGAAASQGVLKARPFKSWITLTRKKIFF